MIRYYAGKLKCERISEATKPFKTALYKALEDGIIGSIAMGFRNVIKGELFMAPYRRVFIEQKNREQDVL